MNNQCNIAENINKCKGFRGKMLEGERFSGHTTFKTGGLIPLYAEPVDEADLKTLLEFFRQNSIPSFILGGGSNIVPADDGVDFAVISTAGLDGISVCAKNSNKTSGVVADGGAQECAGLSENGSSQNASDNAETLLLTCGSGTPIEKITGFCAENGLSGLESFAGLPGTAGGAVYMNARCYGVSISDVLESVRYARCSEDSVSFAEYAMRTDDWDYKKSPFQNTPDVIVSVSFRVTRGDKAEIRKKAESFVEDRRSKGHFRYPSAGSVFKNNREFGKPSGQIIQDAGLRGLSDGGAQVAPWHGNIIINTGNATSAEIKRLSDTVVSEVKRKFGFELENEIMFVDSGIVR